MLTLWRPQYGLLNWSNELERLLGWNSGNGEKRSFAPAVDIEENESQFVVRTDVPGVNEKDLEVRVHEGTLVVSGKREEAKQEKNERGYYRERHYGSFRRSFRLGTEVDEARIEASYHNGVLTVMLPKKEAAKPRQIPVQAN